MDRWVRVVCSPRGDTVELLVTAERELVVRVWDQRMAARAEVRLPADIAVQLSYVTGDAMDFLGSPAPVAAEAPRPPVPDDHVTELLERTQRLAERARQSA